LYFFFFQAEDGIRDRTVTGVQTCALPISGKCSDKHFFPEMVHVNVSDVVTFKVIDTLDVGTARGDYQGHLPGVVRPKLEWTTEYRSRSQSAQRLEAGIV